MMRTTVIVGDYSYRNDETNAVLSSLIAARVKISLVQIFFILDSYVVIFGQKIEQHLVVGN